MQDVEILHREAMELVDQAVNARQRGDTTVANELTKAAFAQEQAAANLVANLLDLEPTRSVLHRSAAMHESRVFRITRSRKAYRTCARGLSALGYCQ